MTVAMPSGNDEKNATMTAASAPSVAPTVGIKSAMATHIASAQVNRSREETLRCAGF